MMQASYDATDEVLEALLAKGYDYSEYREKIAQEAFDNGLLNGNRDVTVECEGEKSLRFIQEDEYANFSSFWPRFAGRTGQFRAGPCARRDQHMDDAEDVPEFSEQVAYVCSVPSYVWQV